MRKVRNIAQRHQWLVLTLGILLGVFIVLSSQPAEKEVAKDLTEQSESDSTTVQSSVPEAVPSAAQELPERTSYLIEILPDVFEIEKVEMPEEIDFPVKEKVFKVLFRHIISPNSP